MNPLEFPKLEYFVNDFSSVLNQSEKEKLNELFALHQNTTGEQVVVVLFPNRNGNELLDIGMKLFNENGIGKKGQNNGLLLVIATEEKKIRIVTGKGMEIKYTEMKCRDIIENHLRPLLNNGKYEDLIREFSQEIQSKNTGANDENGVDFKKSRDANKALSIFGGFFSLFAFIFSDSFTSGIITIGISIIFMGIIWRLKKEKTIRIGIMAHLITLLLLIIGILGVFFPANCVLINETISNGKSYHCERNILGYNSTYTKTVGGYSVSSSSNGSSSSHHDSGGSSFHGGGGSSNGGGYGD